MIMRAIGLDLGSKRIGVAVSDSGGVLATPIDMVERSDVRADHERIAALVEEWEAEIVVVGLPYSLDGGTGPAAQRALAEIAALGDTLTVPVVPYDERLTTVTAERNLMQQGMTGVARRAVVDQVAASVILQSWLDAGCPGGR
jgi:putative Holliday junction resolvase